jgi:RNA polymerase sigma factor (sigma-70 family)
VRLRIQQLPTPLFGSDFQKILFWLKDLAAPPVSKIAIAVGKLIMPANPETRDSLILRLPTQSDAQAWREFIEIYEPLLFRFARRRGLQDADAREIAQNVFLSVAKAVQRWQPSKEKGRFRAWLFCIARNQLINYLAKHGKQRGSGNTTQLRLLRELPQSTPEIDEITNDYRKEMFRLAAAQARDCFQPSSWSAFWRIAVLGQDVQQVAAELQLSPTAVYIARSRVTAKIREIVQQWESEDVI